MELSLPRTFAPGSESTWERKFQGVKVPGSESTRERKYQGAKVPPMVLSLLGAKVRGNESSSYQQTDRHTTFRRPVE